MLLIGVTGGPGSGKTTVANMFRDLGVPLLPSHGTQTSLLWSTLKLTLIQGYTYALVDLSLPAPPALPFIEKRLLVTCEKDLQLHRIMEARSLSEKNSTILLEAHSSYSSSSIKSPAITIDNSSSLTDTKEQVLSLHESNFSYIASQRRLGTLAAGLLLLLMALAKYSL